MIKYYKNLNNHIVVDVSGSLSIDDINKNFGGDFTDVTSVTNEKAFNDKKNLEEIQEIKKITKLSATAKLKALGLTEDEINSFVK